VVTDGKLPEKYRLPESSPKEGEAVLEIRKAFSRVAARMMSMPEQEEM
jgi:hypothetical protein